jgi:uncharacterized protein (DUF305 family)
MKNLAITFALLLALPVAASAQMNASTSCPGPNGRMMQQAKTPGDQALMQSMMPMRNGMMGMRMTGNTDKDFVAMMIPHHESAVAMAQAELKYGTDPKIKAMAQSMLDAQQKEIDAMKAWQTAQQ